MKVGRVVVVCSEMFATTPFIVSIYVHFLVILWLIITGTRQKYFLELHYDLKKLDYSKIEKRLINQLIVNTP